MIIDLILDRKYYDNEGIYRYKANTFYYDIVQYENIFKFEPDISKAMDYGSNEDVQKALCDYIEEQGYNKNIKNYIKSKNWIEND